LTLWRVDPFLHPGSPESPCCFVFDTKSLLAAADILNAGHAEVALQIDRAGIEDCIAIFVAIERVVLVVAYSAQSPSQRVPVIASAIFWK